MITVLGKLKDTAAYIGKDGYNVYAKCDDWTPQKNFYWLCDAVARGDDFLIVSRDASGQFLQELYDLMNILLKFTNTYILSLRPHHPTKRKP